MVSLLRVVMVQKTAQQHHPINNDNSYNNDNN